MVSDPPFTLKLTRELEEGEWQLTFKNGTLILVILVPRPSDVNLVRSRWLFKHTFHADGTLSRYKARLVAKDSNQQHGVDFDKTFSLVVKPATIRTVLSLAVVYASAPGFVDSRYPNHIVDSLYKEFDMTDLGALNYFLGISAVRHPTGLFLSQKKYARQLLELAHMVNCNPSRTPIDTDSKLGSRRRSYSGSYFIP
ncbi:ribonuclease H-like domain-containing protein [Tanacetum coccineum]